MKYFLLLSFAVLYLLGQAEVVDSNRAKRIAELFYQQQFYKFNKQSIEAKTIKSVSYNYKNKTTFYINIIQPKGFVIVTADDESYPIFGYSFENEIMPESLPENLVEYLNAASEQIIKPAINPTQTYKNIWKEIESTNLYKVSFSTNAISPLINLRWDQGVPYNNYCPPHPNGPGGHCVTGCVATAMAMVMKYHNYPEHGRGMKTYYWYEMDTIDYENTYYRWNQMTITANSQSADAIAELMYHCGISVDMAYGPDESGSYTQWIPGALKYYFRYHPSVRFYSRSKFFDDEWDRLIRDELTYKRPVIYSGSGTGGHAFICDGFQDTCYYHFNWGWGGYANGYYYYNDLKPGNNDFSYGQGAVVNIMPYFSSYCVANAEITDTTRTINDGSGLSFYWNNTNCSWLIKPQNNKPIYLYFNNFNTEPNNDVLYIYDGQNELAPLIGSYSGYSLPPSIQSTGNSLFLKFVTNDTIQAQGWEAYYSTSPVGINNNNIVQLIKVFPNPASDKLYIQNPYNSSIYIELYNAFGIKVLDEKQMENKLIDVSTLLPGIYIAKVYINNQSYTYKISIVR